jgi:hypothetical protein
VLHVSHISYPLTWSPYNIWWSVRNPNSLATLFDPTQSQLNPLCTATNYFHKIHFNVILQNLHFLPYMSVQPIIYTEL